MSIRKESDNSRNQHLLPLITKKEQKQIESYLNRLSKILEHMDGPAIFNRPYLTHESHLSNLLDTLKKRGKNVDYYRDRLQELEAVAENIDNGVVEERIRQEIARGEVIGKLGPRDESEKSGYRTNKHTPSLYVY